MTTQTSRSLRRLYRDYARRVRWVVRLRGVREDAIDDVVQDVFVALHQRASDADPEVPTVHWVDGVARNVAFSHRRAEARRRARVAAHPLVPNDAPTPDDVVAQRQAWDALQAFLAELDEQQREAFVLCVILRTAAATVAQTQGCSVNTVYSRVRLARRKFEQTFGDAEARRLFIRQAMREEQPRSHRRAFAAIVARVTDVTPAAPVTAGARPAVGGWSLAKVAVAAAVVAGGTAAVVSATPDGPEVQTQASPQPSSAPRPDGTATPTDGRSASVPAGPAPWDPSRPSPAPGVTPAAGTRTGALGHRDTSDRGVQPADGGGELESGNVPSREVGLGNGGPRNGGLGEGGPGNGALGNGGPGNGGPGEGGPGEGAPGNGDRRRGDPAKPAPAGRLAGEADATTGGGSGRRRAAGPGSSARGPARPDADPSTPADPLAGDLVLLGSAKTDLVAGRVHRALARLAEHAERYPNSDLEAQRRTLERRAVCRLSPAEQATLREGLRPSARGWSCPKNGEDSQ